MPRHNSYVVHPRWSQENEKVSRNAMDSKCEIFWSDGVFDRESGGTTGNKTVVYSGVCRVFPTAIGRNVNSADQYIPSKQFTVVIPFWVNAVEIDHNIKFSEAEDATLLSKLFVVREILRSSFIWERHFICTEDQERENQI